MTRQQQVEAMRKMVARQTGVPLSRLAPLGAPTSGMALGAGSAPERFVLWGGRVGRDAWVGSMWDRCEQVRLWRVEHWRRVNRQLTVTMRVMTDAFTKAIKQAEAQMAAFGKAMREGGVLPPEV